MGFLSWSGKTLRRETLYVAGGAGIKGWWEVVQRNWLGTKRRCPACDEGRMFPFTEPIDGVNRDFLGCSRCDHFEVADLSNTKDAAVVESLGRLRQIADQRLTDLAADERQVLRRRLKIGSRVNYGLSLAMILIGAYLLHATGTAWMLINMTALAVLMFAHGLRASYRYWQVSNNVFFQPGSFRRWLGLGQWLI